MLPHAKKKPVDFAYCRKDLLGKVAFGASADGQEFIHRSFSNGKTALVPFVPPPDWLGLRIVQTVGLTSRRYEEEQQRDEANKQGRHSNSENNVAPGELDGSAAMSKGHLVPMLNGHLIAIELQKMLLNLFLNLNLKISSPSRIVNKNYDNSSQCHPISTMDPLPQLLDPFLMTPGRGLYNCQTIEVYHLMEFLESQGWCNNRIWSDPTYSRRVPTKTS
ncbi:hypothetical protein AVEN_166023-1 [Araneus ventricosus]|uniref:Uncharacterized protein n=1 Tax=Araneus ventricosus TaxID=182803 RepID=A0A4Y2L4C3_ARAVE|nr:hypothetical protein AVEN_166023-1 [Araneus ventricosus]